jgi:hypothetical protein
MAGDRQECNVATEGLLVSRGEVTSRGWARSGRGGAAPHLGALERTMRTKQKIIRANVAAALMGGL